MTNSYVISRSSFATNYSVIFTPGSYIVKAGNSHRIYDEKLGKYKWIVNLKAVADRNVEAVKEAFGDEESISMEELNGLTMTYNIIENEGQTVELPMKNSEVKISADHVTTKDGRKILVVTGLVVPPAVKAKSFSFSDLSNAEASYDTLNAVEQTINVANKIEVEVE